MATVHDVTDSVRAEKMCLYYCIIMARRALKRGSKRGQASKENDVDPDLVDFAEPVKKKRFKQPQPKETTASLSKGFVPINTSKNTAWAVKVSF